MMKSGYFLPAMVVLMLHLSGCETGRSVDGGPPVDDEPPVHGLSGTWEAIPDGSSGREVYAFHEDGTFRLSEAEGSSRIYEGEYRVTDSMIHLVLFRDGKPLEEIWVRSKLVGDSMDLYKGILLEGGSNALVGVWSITASIADSLGRLNRYHYDFREDGTLIQSFPGDYADTSRYAHVGTGIDLTDVRTGAIKFHLGYDLTEGHLALYNLETEKRFYRRP